MTDAIALNVPCSIGTVVGGFALCVCDALAPGVYGIVPTTAALAAIGSPIRHWTLICAGAAILGSASLRGLPLMWARCSDSECCKTRKAELNEFRFGFHILYFDNLMSPLLVKQFRRPKGRKNLQKSCAPLIFCSLHARAISLSMMVHLGDERFRHTLALQRNVNREPDIQLA
jgi:hypothetical protein